jgi:hypothetical protein
MAPKPPSARGAPAEPGRPSTSDSFTAPREEGIMSRVKMAYLDDGAAPSHRGYGWVTG